MDSDSYSYSFQFFTLSPFENDVSDIKMLSGLALIFGFMAKCLSK